MVTNKIDYLICILICFILASQFSRCRNVPYDTHEIGWKTDGIQLSGTLLLPKNEIKGSVILLHGSGTVDRKHKAYSLHAKKLAELGMAVFYYDKRGVGKSKGDWKEATFNDLVDDALNVIPKLQEFPKIKNVKIGFMGFSQGGWLCLMAHDKYPQTAFLMTISGSVNTPVEQGRFINRKILEQNGYSNEIQQIADSLDVLISHVYRTNDDWEKVQTVLDKYQDEPWYTTLRMGLQPKDSWNWKWYAKLPFDYDPKPTLNNLSIPLFAAHGQKDVLIDAEKASTYLDSLRILGKDFTNYIESEGGHLLTVKKSTWNDAYWEAIESWLTNKNLISIANK